MSRPRHRLVAVDVGGSSAGRPLWLCRHEAAHAVVAHHVGVHVVGVHVNARGGQTICSLPRRPDPLRIGMLTMAGHAADVLWSRFPEAKFPADDLADLRAQGFRGPSLPTLFALAAGACQVNEAQIRRVAAALKKGDLGRLAFLKALRDPPTPADVAAAKHGRAWLKQVAHDKEQRALSIAAERAERRSKRRRLK